MFDHFVGLTLKGLNENVGGGDYRIRWHWDICPNLPKIGPKNEKIIDSIQ